MRESKSNLIPHPFRLSRVSGRRAAGAPLRPFQGCSQLIDASVAIMPASTMSICVGTSLTAHLPKYICLPSAQPCSLLPARHATTLRDFRAVACPQLNVPPQPNNVPRRMSHPPPRRLLRYHRLRHGREQLLCRSVVRLERAREKHSQAHRNSTSKSRQRPLAGSFKRRGVPI